MLPVLRGARPALSGGSGAVTFPAGPPPEPLPERGSGWQRWEVGARPRRSARGEREGPGEGYRGRCAEGCLGGSGGEGVRACAGGEHRVGGSGCPGSEGSLRGQRSSAVGGDGVRGAGLYGRGAVLCEAVP